jgi:chemotaxis protein MotB
MPREGGRQPEHENHDRWLVSYADFITLLFAFFVVMFATAQTDKSKAQQVSDSVKKALAGQPMSTVVSAILGKGPNTKPRVEHAPPPPPPLIAAEGDPTHLVELLPFQKTLAKELEGEIKSGRVQLSMGPRGLTISFRQAALFPSGEDVIASDAYPSIQKIARAMSQIPNPARLEGHTDSIPIHNSRFRSNWELSAARSIALLELLTKRFEVPADRISIAGYAETAPIADNGTDDGRTRNRRADIVILNETGLKGEPERRGRMRE